MEDGPSPHTNCFSCSFFSEDIAKRARIHSVGKSFNAFAANLLPNEAKRLQGLHEDFYSDIGSWKIIACPF